MIVPRTHSETRTLRDGRSGNQNFSKLLFNSELRKTLSADL